MSYYIPHETVAEFINSEPNINLFPLVKWKPGNKMKYTEPLCAIYPTLSFSVIPCRYAKYAKYQMHCDDMIIGRIM